MQNKNQSLHFGSIAVNAKKSETKSVPNLSENKAGSEKKPFPSPIDKVLGENIKRARIHNGMSQNQLAGKLGITFQQVQKYEKGSNRIVVSRLYPLASALSVSVGELLNGISFEGVSVEEISSPSNQEQTSNSVVKEDGENFLYEDSRSNVNSKEILQLVRYFKEITDDKVRNVIYNLVKSLYLQQSASNTNELPLENANSQKPE